MSALLPVLGFTALGLLLSLVTRNGIAGALVPAVVAGLMQILSFVGGIDPVHHLLLTWSFDAWHGLFADTIYEGPLWPGLLVCAGYTAVFLAAAYTGRRSAWSAARRRTTSDSSRPSSSWTTPSRPTGLACC